MNASATPRRRRKRSLVTPIALTVGLLALISLTIQGADPGLTLALLGAVVVVVGSCHLLFPGSRFFTIGLANFVGIYAIIFEFFVEAHFAKLPAYLLGLGFVLPLAAFLAGVVIRRAGIRAIVHGRPQGPTRRDLRRFGRAFGWVLPLGLVGAATFLLTPETPQPVVRDAFVAAMGFISFIVLLVSYDVVVLLLETGLLFEEFFEQVAGLAEPAFAFFTFYSLLVIIFAALYTVVDRFAPLNQFMIGGVPQRIGFAESLYFSVVTLSTVGYGDIVPVGSFIRLVVAAEVIVGMLLLLFGFNAIFSYSSSRRPPER
ncbi:ion channel [Nitrospirillum sp. BR 11828]|uniref:ion channel n=1 Tax=Nitrospirillum sp. BR 11828 TaxID=3104325 RepID=UPI002ACAB96E|nr:ion channel [Nitrospirillum sp. BR 11828]MDZ5646032.1 ion channel [Nitrospirillum sp. BR 11828]